MPWPDLPWTAAGNWYSQSGAATSGQSQSVAASASIEISGSATAGQASQATIGTLSDVLHIIGASSSGQTQRSLLVGAPRISGRGWPSQAGQTVISSGGIEITGAGASSQGQSQQAFAFKDPIAINTALHRLLEYPHAAVFDKSPEQELALVISTSDSFAWSVAAGVLTATINGIQHKYALRTLTFSALVSLLEDDGATIDYENPVFGSMGAHMLLDAAGDQEQSYGTHMYAYSAQLWALFAAYSVELDEAQYQLIQALRQMIIGQAQDEWLDLWGTLFDHPRRDGLGDTQYAAEIPREAFRIRVNAIAIEKAILEITGKDVIIEEPWEYMFRLSESRLSGGDRLYDGGTTGYHLLRPVSRIPIQWDDVLSVIERNRAAGIEVLGPEVRMAIYADARVKGAVSSARTDYHGTLVTQVVDGRLNFMRLSAGSYQRNYRVSISALNTYSLLGECPASASMQYVGLSGITWNDPNTWGEFTWTDSGGVASDVIGVDGNIPSSSVYYDFDEVSV